MNIKRKASCFISLSLVAILMAAFLGFVPCAFAKEKKLPVLGSDPVTNIRIIGNHSEALGIWLREKISGATVVHIDAYHDMRPIDPATLDELRKVASDAAEVEKRGNTGPDGLFDMGNFLAAAVNLGIVKRIYWVIPYTYFWMDNPAKYLEDHLIKSGFAPEEAKAFKLENGMFYGKAFGADLFIVTPNSLPVAPGPVIISFDLDFITTGASVFSRSESDTTDALFRELYKKNLEVTEAVISESVEYEYVSPLLLWLGDLAALYLKVPGLNKDHPDYGVFNNLSFIHGYFRMSRGMSVDWRVFQKGEADLLPFASYMALNAFLEGNLEQALNISMNICVKDRKYCPLPAELGLMLLEKRKLSEADVFFESAASVDPSMNYGLKGYALSNLIRGNYAKAAELYEKLAFKSDPFEGFLMAGFCSGKLGEKEKELQLYTKAISQPKDGVFQRPPVRSEIVLALKTAALLFENLKNEKMLQLIKSRPDFREALLLQESKP